MAEHPEAGGLAAVATPVEMTYAVVIKRGRRNFSAYVPDLPGCIATGSTVEELLANMREAVALHLEGMYEDGDLIPPPDTLVATVTVRDPRA